MKTKNINILKNDVTTQNVNRLTSKIDSNESNSIMGDLVMKNNMKHIYRISRNSFFLIAILFFFNVMLVSANDSRVIIDNNNGVAEVEEELQLETWMLNVDQFEKLMSESMNLTFINEQEVQVESWMLNPFLFENKVNDQSDLSNKRNEITEDEMELENWMLDTKAFGGLIENN